MTTASTPIEWAYRIGTYVVDHFAGLDTGWGAFTLKVGNPNVSGDAGDCNEVHVDLGDVYECEEPWPTPRRDTTGRGRVSDMDAVDFVVAVQVCVPVVQSTGAAPDALVRDPSVRDVGEAGFELFRAMKLGREEWRGRWGRVALRECTPVPKEGGITRWELACAAPLNCVDG